VVLLWELPESLSELSDDDDAELDDAAASELEA
jgi:hypothetical protein